ncbi:hypothetical protein GJAV_G00137590 [Gymnothorax javanicus]|nr:hypothetical protein GJAV_G00137590 [Gymnothorax javanicus]
MREGLLGRLDKLAVITEQGRHWERAEASGKGSLAVEMTSYVLLATPPGPALPGHDMTYHAPIVSWLTDQQNSYGGFSSTQDTVVALQALTLYAAATFSKTGASTVTVMTSMGGYEGSFTTMDEHNRLLYQEEEQLQELPGRYTIKAEGGSCAFVQLTLQYNIPPPPDFSSFTINASAAGVCNSAKKSLRVFINARYNGGREETNMVIISIRLLSGFLLDKSSLIPLKAHRTVKRVEEEEDHVIIYLDELKKNVPEAYVLGIVEDVPVRNLKPAVVKIYDYYDKSDEAVTEYSSPCADNDDFNVL